MHSIYTRKHTYYFLRTPCILHASTRPSALAQPRARTLRHRRTHSHTRTLRHTHTHVHYSHVYIPHESVLSPSLSFRPPLRAHECIDICRVCRTAATPGRPLFYPCLCTGSIKYIHQDWYVHVCHMCTSSSIPPPPPPPP